MQKLQSLRSAKAHKHQHLNTEITPEKTMIVKMKDLFVRLAEYLKAQEREKKDDEKQIISRSKKKYKKERESEEEEEDEDVMMEIMLELPCCDPPPILPIHYFPIRRINKKRSRPK